ncbi:MAG: DHHA1 domain-containing protein [Candidatus Gastranaerophilales bacterium]|nr:DHHA1 domain-containing protein [Candidatus Gastranaerophilales bacterium]
MINPINNTNNAKIHYYNKLLHPTSFGLKESSPDNFEFQEKTITTKNIIFKQKGNISNVVFFKGLENPAFNWDESPRFKMKIANVSRFQNNIKEIPENAFRTNPDLNFKFYKDKEEIGLIYPPTGRQVGFIDYDILNHLYDDIKNNPNDFRIKLCNKSEEFEGMKCFGLKAHLIYVGNNPDKMKEKFNNIFEDIECQKIIYEPTSAQNPEMLLKTILKYDEQLHGTEEAKKTEEIINNIANEIQNPANETILLVGHSGPDGDTIGCVLGMKNAIKMTDKNKRVDCAIDDRIPELFSYIPGVKKIKMISKEEKLKLLDMQIKNSAYKGTTDAYKNLKKHLETSVKTITPNKKYDLIIFMDVSSPERFGASLKSHVDPSKTKLIFIDHHPERINEWDKMRNETGIDVKKAKNNNLYWVEDRIPAAVDMITVIAGKLLPWLNNDDKEIPAAQKDLFENFSTAIMTGLYTDTGSMSRNANLFEEDYALQRWERPFYKTKGLAKWFSEKTNQKISTNFISKNLSEHDSKLKKYSYTIRRIAKNGIFQNNAIGLGYIQVNAKDFHYLKSQMIKDNPEYTETDVYGCFKYPYIGKLRRPSFDKNNVNNKYNKDKIAYLAVQYPEGKIRFSFRSKQGSNHAALLGNLFNGGGHNSAAGGRIKIPNVDFNTKLVVKLNGKIEENPEEILKVLKRNFQLNKSSLPNEEKEILLTRVSVETSNNNSGRNVHQLINDVVQEIRKEQEITTPTEQNTSEKVLLKI